MQYLAEPTAATFKGCGYELQQHPEKTKPKTTFFQRMFGLKFMCSCVTSVFCWFFRHDIKKNNNNVFFLDRMVEFRRCKTTQFQGVCP